MQTMCAALEQHKQRAASQPKLASATCCTGVAYREFLHVLLSGIIRSSSGVCA